MAGPSSHPKTTSHSLYIFSLNSPSYSSSSSSSSSTSPTLISMKLKGTLAHTRIARALSRAKSIIIHILKDLQLIEFVVAALGVPPVAGREKARGNSGASDHADDIDRLADMFIANSHEKFRLEKQESNRRFQEMMARSV
ncbi:hypothetical protein C3L33_02086, partial [Rhododendron williamsianum]